MFAEGFRLDASGSTGTYLSHNRAMIADVTGKPVLSLGLVPRPFVARAMAAARRATMPPLDVRLAAIAHAGREFASGIVAGMSAAEHECLVSTISGLPVAVVRAANAEIERATGDIAHIVEQARPRGAVWDWRDPAAARGTALWARRGSVLAVHAPGNNPGVHSLWPDALALGYRVAVRPSRRDPLSPFRLLTAFREAGLPGDCVEFLPTDHAVARELLTGADLGLVYGGEDVVQAYRGDSRIRAQGPGRSKILITSDKDWRQYLDVIVDSVLGLAGTACVNTTAVLVEGDPGPVAEAIAARLAIVPSLPPQDEQAVLPVQRTDIARGIERRLLEAAADTKPWLGGNGNLALLGDGSAVLRPAVHQVDSSTARQIRVELPFPCVWVAPWNRSNGVDPLKDSLVVTAITEDDLLVDELLAETSISNVYVGEHPTHWRAPGIPHDGYIADFLMRTKAVIK